jgi:Flp pilus assembly protein TadG
MKPAERMARRRGSAMIESALALLVFAVLMAGVMEIGLTLFISNSLAFAAQRAARYASVRGGASGHPASAADIRATALAYAAPLNPEGITVTVTWSPNNNAGGTVLVKVSYAIRPMLLPLAASIVTLESSARQTVTQ